MNDDSINHNRPQTRPSNPCFSSGPTRKRPGWSPAVLADALVGRSHRSPEGQERIRHCLGLMRRLLALPDDYRIAIVPGSDTGAVEMAMWTMLGGRGVDLFSWDAFGEAWARDAAHQLKLPDLRVFKTEYGALPDLTAASPAHDIVLTWNGTAAGVAVPDAEWIDDDREGLVIADATSAAFAMPLPWEKLDVVTFSWQKALGGEAAHGVIILSPRAINRLETYTPPWPVPKLFALAPQGRVNHDFFDGLMVNTPSMLVIEDAIDALTWAESIGGGAALLARSAANAAIIRDWVDGHDEIDFLALDPATISPTSMTFQITAPWFTDMGLTRRKSFITAVTGMLSDEGIAHDITAYRAAPPGFRVWAGPMVESDDLSALLPWIDWGIAAIR